jgi:hypothetical protein
MGGMDWWKNYLKADELQSVNIEQMDQAMG